MLLIAGGAFVLPAVASVRLNTSWVWPFVAIGTGVAFLLEWRYAKGHRFEAVTVRRTLKR
jgi:hypothetical protein